MSKHLLLLPVWNLLICICLIHSITGCSRTETKQEVNEDNYAKIKIGTTLETLEKRFGEGKRLDEKETYELFGSFESEKFEEAKNTNSPAPEAVVWQNHKFSLMVLLVDGKVVAKAEEGELHDQKTGMTRKAP